MFHESKMMQQHGIKARSSIYCVPFATKLMSFSIRPKGEENRLLFAG